MLFSSFPLTVLHIIVYICHCHLLNLSQPHLLLLCPQVSVTFISTIFLDSRYPLTDECIKKLLWFIYIMEYYSAVKRNESKSVVVRWMNLESVIQSEVSQKEENKHHTWTTFYNHHTHHFIALCAWQVLVPIDKKRNQN